MDFKWNFRIIRKLNLFHFVFNQIFFRHTTELIKNWNGNLIKYTLTILHLLLYWAVFELQTKKYLIKQVTFSCGVVRCANWLCIIFIAPLFFLCMLSTSTLEGTKYTNTVIILVCCFQFVMEYTTFLKFPLSFIFQLVGCCSNTRVSSYLNFHCTICIELLIVIATFECFIVHFFVSCAVVCEWVNECVGGWGVHFLLITEKHNYNSFHRPLSAKSVDAFFPFSSIL